MRVLILGGTAFIGPHVLRKLGELGHELTIFHRGQTEPDDLPPGVRHVHGDRFNIAPHVEALRNLHPEVVLDMFAEGEGDARAVMEAFTGVARRLVGLSSADVYLAYDILRGRHPEPLVSLPMTEEAPLRRQLYPYRDGKEHEKYEKILAEREFFSRPDDLPATILRLPGVHGPGDSQRRDLGYLKRMMDRRPAILLGSDKAHWRFCRGYVENVADAVVLAVSCEKAARRVYNVSDPDTLTEREWVEALARVFGYEGRIVTVPDDELPGHLRQLGFNRKQSWDLDTSRIRTELGYAERIGREEGLRRTLAWHIKHPPEHVDQQKFDYDAEDQFLRRFTG